MQIPVEHAGNERQRIPALLVGIKKGFGLIKYSSSSTHLKVPLSELLLAPSAFDPYNDEDQTTHVTGNSPVSLGKALHSFSVRDPVEVWLSTKSTTHGDQGDNDSLEEDGHTKKEIPFAGAWWPGRVLAIQGGFAHVEVSSHWSLVGYFPTVP
ncbi:unnamed protein product [Dicrocoelium dendriticum]|nr:unnamed protein product [Dicrocoelium dendriticum]